MVMEISCPVCGESGDLAGSRGEDHITVTCGNCGQRWDRSLDPECRRCGGGELETVPLAIVEKSRGTQLSVVGIRMVELCVDCDADAISRWQRSRPNPLLPDELPNESAADT